MLASSITRPDAAAESTTPIEAHVAIGDGRSVALTDGRGAIDWLCWPRFDSDPLFAAILDVRRGGSFRIAPRHVRHSSAGYVGETNVAITRFELRGAEVELLDMMAIDGDGIHERSLAAEHEIVRLITCTRGRAEIDVTIDPRPAFGTRRPRGKIDAHGTLRFHDRGQLVTLRASQPVFWREDAEQVLTCSFALDGGNTVAFSLSFAADGPLVFSPLVDTGRAILETTLETWR